MNGGSPRQAEPQVQRPDRGSEPECLSRTASGLRGGECFRQHRSVEFRKFLNTINREVCDDLEVHLVLDNLSTHKPPIIKAWLARHPRFHVHFLPTHSSWLNQVERWFGLLTERQLKRGVHRSTSALEKAIREFLDAHNEHAAPFKWTKTADEILAKVAGFCRRTLKAHPAG